MTVEVYYGPVTSFVRTENPAAITFLTQLLTVHGVDGNGGNYFIPFFNTVQSTILTGHLPYVESQLRRYGFDCKVFNSPFPVVGLPEPPDNLLATVQEPNFRPYPFQLTTARKMIALGRGNVQIGTGGGKTETFILAMRYLEHLLGRPIKSLTLTNVDNLAEQMVGRMTRRGLTGVTQFASGKIKSNHIVSVVNGFHAAMKAGNSAVLEHLATADVFCCDESHHVQSSMNFDVGLACNAYYRWGLSATLYGNVANPFSHPDDMRIMGVTGPVIAHLPFRFLRDNGYVPDPEITFIPCDQPKSSFKQNVFGRSVDTGIWRGSGFRGSETGIENDLIVTNPFRNEMIRRLVYWTLQQEAESKFVILVVRKDHAALLQKILWSCGVYSICSLGSRKVITIDQKGKQHTWKDSDNKMLADFTDGKQRVMIGTQKFDEGQSIPDFSDLILAQAGKGGESQRRVFQRVGRSLHTKTGRKPRVYDFFDMTHHMVQHQSQTRYEALNREGYPVRISCPPHIFWPLENFPTI